MRIWFSLPFVGRTRIGFSVSHQELRRAFRGTPSPRLSADEWAEIERRSEAFGKKWAPAVTKIIWLLIGAALAVFPWWLVSLALAHAGTCRVFSDGGNTVEACENGSVTVTYPDGRRVQYGEEPNAGFERYPAQCRGIAKCCVASVQPKPRHAATILSWGSRTRFFTLRVSTMSRA